MTVNNGCCNVMVVLKQRNYVFYEVRMKKIRGMVFSVQTVKRSYKWEVLLDTVTPPPK